MITLHRCPFCIMEVEIACCQINVSVIERGVRYIVGELCKVGILGPIELSTTLKYLYFWTRDCIRFRIFKGWFSLAMESESES